MTGDSTLDTAADARDLWVTRAVDAVQTNRLPTALLASIGTFGLLPTVVIAWLVVGRWGRLPAGFVVGVICVAVWLNVAPYLIWRYDSVTFPTFAARVRDVVSRETDLTALTAEFDRHFARRWWVFALPTTALGIPMMVLGRPFLRDSAGVTPADPLYWVLFAVVLWLGVLIGIGVAGVATTVFVVREFTAREFDIDPLHPDGKAGLSAVGTLAVRTTVLLSMGSFLLPIQFHYVAVAGSAPLRTLVYLLVVGYTAAIFLSFAVPVVLANRRAERLREAHLDSLRAAYEEAKAEAEGLAAEDAPQDRRAAAELRSQRIREEYRIYQGVTLYPTDLGVISRVTGSVLLPLVFTALDAFLDKDVLLGAVDALV